MPKRVRDAGTGKMVSPAEAKARPKETVTEDAKPSLEKRVALLEAVIKQAGGTRALYMRLKG